MSKSSSPSTPAKKTGWLTRIKSGIAKLLGNKEEKSQRPPAPPRQQGDWSPSDKTKREPRQRGEGKERQREPRGPRPERAEGEQRSPHREGRAERGERGQRTEQRGKGANHSRGEGSGRNNERSGERGRRGDNRSRRGPEREREDGNPRVKHEPQPAPLPPPVPAGPYPEAFEVLGLSPALLAGIAEAGFSTPTQIQRDGIPLVLQGKDVVGASQTGTGKTAAFGLPAMSRLGAPGKMRLLVLEPTRELCLQVVDNLSRLAKHTGLRILPVYGGVGYGAQREGLEKGVDVVVATPGRLLDFMSDHTFDPSTLEIVVLDEVDRMLDMGFLPDVRKIMEKTPESRQTLFFSATMPQQIKSLADWALKEPVSVEVGIRFSPAETVSHYLYPIAYDQRDELLMTILKQTHFTSCMIFTRTKIQADELYANLQATGEYKVAVMHSDIKQRDREKALQGFREGEFEVIVATDLAARGLDVSGVTHVINYCVPENPEDYVHRIGRTGRAQQEGDAFTLFAADEMKSVEAIETLIDQKIERRKVEGFPYKFTTILEDERHARSIMRTGRAPKRRR